MVECSYERCKYQSTSPHEVVQHELSRHYQGKCFCPICRSPLASPVGLRQQVNDLHTRSRQYACPICKAVFHDQARVSKCVKRHLDAHLCPKCGFRSSEENRTRLHLRVVHGDSRWDTRLLKSIPGTPHPPRSNNRSATQAPTGDYASIDWDACTRSDLLTMSEQVRPQVWAEMYQRHWRLLGADPTQHMKPLYPEVPAAPDHKSGPQPTQGSEMSTIQSGLYLGSPLDRGMSAESMEDSPNQPNPLSLPTPTPSSSPQILSLSVTEDQHIHTWFDYGENDLESNLAGPSVHPPTPFQSTGSISTTDCSHPAAQNLAGYSNGLYVGLGLGRVDPEIANRSILQGIPGTSSPSPETTCNIGAIDTTDAWPSRQRDDPSVWNFLPRP